MASGNQNNIEMNLGNIERQIANTQARLATLQSQRERAAATARRPLSASNFKFLNDFVALYTHVQRLEQAKYTVTSLKGKIRYRRDLLKTARQKGYNIQQINNEIAQLQAALAEAEGLKDQLNPAREQLQAMAARFILLESVSMEQNYSGYGMAYGDPYKVYGQIPVDKLIPMLRNPAEWSTWNWEGSRLRATMEKGSGDDYYAYNIEIDFPDGFNKRQHLIALRDAALRNN